MKNKLTYIFIFLVALVVIGAIIYFIDRRNIDERDIFPEGLIINKTTPVKLPFDLILEPNQETVAVFRELNGKEIKMESFFDTGFGCAAPDVVIVAPWYGRIIKKIKDIIAPSTLLNIYPTNDRLYTEEGYQPRPSELNACAKGPIIQFKIQTPYNPEKDVYYLVIKQNNKVKLKIKLPSIKGNLEEIVKKTLIKIYDPLKNKTYEIFDYHPLFQSLQSEIFKLINFSDVFYTVNPKSPANTVEDVKKSDYQESAKNLIENTKKKTVVVELSLDKTRELILDHFSPYLKIEVQKIILQKDLITGNNLLGYSICAVAKDNLIYCFSNKLGLTGERKEINKIIEQIKLLD